MRLNEWAARAPHPDAMSAKVLGVVRPVLAALGAEPDPEAFVVWADDPDRYFLLAIAPAGLVTCHVRVNAPQEGPRAAGRLIRWSRLQVGELAVETQGRTGCSRSRSINRSCAVSMATVTRSRHSSTGSSPRRTADLPTSAMKVTARKVGHRRAAGDNAVTRR